MLITDSFHATTPYQDPYQEPVISKYKKVRTKQKLHRTFLYLHLYLKQQLIKPFLTLKAWKKHCTQ